MRVSRLEYECKIQSKQKRNQKKETLIFYSNSIPILHPISAPASQACAK